MGIVGWEVGALVVWCEAPSWCGDSLVISPVGWLGWRRCVPAQDRRTEGVSEWAGLCADDADDVYLHAAHTSIDWGAFKGLYFMRADVCAVIANEILGKRLEQLVSLLITEAGDTLKQPPRQARRRIEGC